MNKLSQIEFLRRTLNLCDIREIEILLTKTDFEAIKRNISNLEMKKLPLNYSTREKYDLICNYIDSFFKPYLKEKSLANKEKSKKLSLFKK